MDICKFLTILLREGIIGKTLVYKLVWSTEEFREIIVRNVKFYCPDDDLINISFTGDRHDELIYDYPESTFYFNNQKTSKCEVCEANGTPGSDCPFGNDEMCPCEISIEKTDVVFDVWSVLPSV